MQFALDENNAENVTCMQVHQEMHNLLEVARITESFALNTRCALKFRRFSTPVLSSLRCFAFIRLTPTRQKWAAAPWGVGVGGGGGGGKGRMTFLTTFYSFFHQAFMENKRL